MAALQTAGVPEPENFRDFLAGLHAAHYRAPGDFKIASQEGLAGAGLPAGLWIPSWHGSGR